MRTKSKSVPLCACGCKRPVNKFRGVYKKFVLGHNSRTEEFQTSLIRRSKEACGEKASRWNGGEHKGRGGYVYIYTGVKKRSIRRCRLVMEQHLGRKLTVKEVVHHKNKVRSDDRIENLQLFASQSQHLAFHRAQGDIK